VSYLLDTNALSEPVRRRPSPAFMARLAAHTGRLATSVLCVGEMIYGARRRGNATIYEDYLREAVLGRLSVLPVDVETAVAYGDLRHRLERRGQPRTDMDLLIAATALRHALVLVTHNTRDFDGIPTLRVEDWTAP